MINLRDSYDPKLSFDKDIQLINISKVVSLNINGVYVSGVMTNFPLYSSSSPSISSSASVSISPSLSISPSPSISEPKLRAKIIKRKPTIFRKSDLPFFILDAILIIPIIAGVLKLLI